MASLLTVRQGGAGVVNSPHDLSATGPYTKTLGPGGVCSPCHIPHAALDNVLWPRNLYEYRTKLINRDGQNPTTEPNFLADTTANCYDCHDYHGGGSIETNSVPALSFFDASNYGHKPQDILFGFVKNSVGNMSEYNAGGQSGKVTPGFFETDPAGLASDYGVNLSASLDQTGGHFYKQDPTTVANDVYDNGDKLACGVCHDPHAWTADGKWQAFFRKNWPNSTVPTRLGSTGAIGSSRMANDATKYNPGSWSIAPRDDADSRLLCTACHGTSDGPLPVFFSDINATFRSDRQIQRPPATVPEHRGGQQAACTACHVHNSVAASCIGCHGFPPSDTASVKYPSSPRTPYTFVPNPDPDTDANPLTADSHPRHSGNRSGQAANSYSVYSFGCGVCHFGSASGIDPGMNQHMNGFVSVVLQGVYTRSPNGSGSFGSYDNTNYYNPRFGYPPAVTGQLDNSANAGGWGGGASPAAGWDNCTNVYCHSAGRALASMGDNDYRRPQWNTGPIGCNGCHGTGTDNAAFGGIAYGMPDYPNTPSTPNSHLAHVISNRYECSVCHAGTVAGSGAGRTILGGNPTRHVNRTRDVVFDNGASGSYDNNTKTCSNISCHGAGTPVWGGTLSNGCFDCHSGTEQVYKPQNDYGASRAANPVDNAEYLWSGHGRTGSIYTGSGNAPAGFSNYKTTPVDCYYCHSQLASHTTKSAYDPFRLGAALDNTFGGLGIFTGQWADNTDALCLGCHGTSAQRSGHDNAAKGPTTVNAQTHARGITGTRYNWPVTPWKCVDCHDPHGDGKSGAERYMMLRSGINAPVDNLDSTAGSDSKGRPKRTDGYVRQVSFNSLKGFSTSTDVAASVYSYALAGDGLGGTWGPCEVCHTQTAAYSRTLDNASSHASRTGRCTTCHPHGAGFAATACKGCHIGSQTPSNAPNVGANWASSGHGKSSITTRRAGAEVQCEDCHDAGYLSGADHKTVVSGTPPANINTLDWPGKTPPPLTEDTTANANTSHLKAAFINAGATSRAAIARQFDNACYGPASGCHLGSSHYHQKTSSYGTPYTGPDQDVMRFGDNNTVQNPKIYNWYGVSNYTTGYPTYFYASPSAWIDNDIRLVSTAGWADAGKAYGLCVSCHDPHGTGATDATNTSWGGGSTNHMLRGNWLSPNSQSFCGGCHR